MVNYQCTNQRKRREEQSLMTHRSKHFCAFATLEVGDKKCKRRQMWYWSLQRQTNPDRMTLHLSSQNTAVVHHDGIMYVDWSDVYLGIWKVSWSTHTVGGFKCLFVCCFNTYVHSWLGVNQEPGKKASEIRSYKELHTSWFMATQWKAMVSG